MLAVEVTNLRKEFLRRDRSAAASRAKRRVPAIKDVSFTIERGECVADPGPERLGQVDARPRCSRRCCSTTAASARIFGHDVVSGERAVRRLVNRVSVEASFFKKMSRRREPRATRRASTACRRRRHDDRIPEILERVGFPAERRGEPMENLSRGMQQKVALARALLTSPVLLLLDEPTTGLDPRSKLEVQEFIREMRRRARRDDPALHARPRRGREPGRPRRHPRPRRAALPRAGRRAARALSAPRRSRRRSSPRPAARSSTRTTRTREVFA